MQSEKTKPSTQVILLLLGLFASNSAWSSTGQILVDVTNAPGEISLDGMPTDQTAPATIEFVSPGEHLIELQHGCLNGSQKVTVVANKRTNARLRMRTVKGSGTLRLRGLPPMAQVFIDDAPVGSASEGIGVPCGGHRVRAEADGFADWEEMVVITTDRWTTSTIEMVEVDIEFAPRPPERVVLRVDEDFDEDLDDWEDIEEDFPREERRLNEQKAQQKREEEARAASVEKRRRDKSSRLSRFGDVDSLDEEEDDEEAFEARSASDFDEQKPARRNRNTKTSRNLGAIVGLTTAGAGAAGLVYGAMAHSQYQGHKDQWTWIAANSGGPLGPAAVEYGETSLQPTKKRRDTALAIGSALILSGSGMSAFFLLPSSDSSSEGTRGRDPLEDLDAFLIHYTGQW
jgi:hypothetical protein